MSESYGLDRVPDSLGFMILNEDGRVLKASGDLVGQERIAGGLHVQSQKQTNKKHR